MLTETQILSFIIKTQNKHRYYKDLTILHTSYLERVRLDENFITEQSGTSDNRPSTSSNIIFETSFDNDNLKIIQQHLKDTDEDSFEKQQDTSRWSIWGCS